MYIVEKIIGKKINERNQTFYKIKWKGYSEHEATWEPVRNVRGVQDMIEEFEIRNRRKMAESLRTNPLKRLRTNDESVERQKYRKETANDGNFLMRNREEEEVENKPRKILKKLNFEDSPPNPQDTNQEKSAEQQNAEPQGQEQDYEENDSGECLMGVDLNELTAKINELANKKKWLRIVSMSKGEDGQFVYQVEREGGRVSKESREYLINNYQDQLIQFYEKHITFQKTRD